MVAGRIEAEARRCEGLKKLAMRYLGWASQDKVPVKMDLDPPWMSRTFFSENKNVDDTISKQNWMNIANLNYAGFHSGQ